MAACLRVASYNLLAPCYAVKWREAEGVTEEQTSNWAQRWPCLHTNLLRARADVLLLQELDADSKVDVIRQLDAAGYDTRYAAHAKRADGVAVAVRSSLLQVREVAVQDWNGASTVHVVVFRPDTQHFAVVSSTHQRGNKPEQLPATLAFATELGTKFGAHVVVVGGDFNEDLTELVEAEVQTKVWPQVTTAETLRGWSALARGHGVPHVSRSERKMDDGHIDWILARGSQGLLRDERAQTAMLASHTKCAATGQMPSDHGMEIVVVKLPELDGAKPPVGDAVGEPVLPPTAPMS